MTEDASHPPARVADPTEQERRVLLLGATGFVGSAVAKGLQYAACEVRTLRTPRLNRRMADDLLRTHHDDAPARQLLTAHIAWATVVINCAGDPDASSRDESALLAANAALPGLIADVVAETGCPRFVHVSSAVVQGRLPILDDSLTYDPFSTYAWSKVMGETVALRWAPNATVVYRPPSVHAPSRRITQTIGKLARSPFSSVAAPPDAPTPQAHIENVAAAIAHLALTPSVPPSIVIHPWEGLTTSSLLSSFGDRDPWVIPRPLARLALILATSLGEVIPSVAAMARRLEMVWMGQAQADSWLVADGWSPLVRPIHWRALATRPGHDTGSHDERSRESLATPQRTASS